MAKQTTFMLLMVTSVFIILTIPAGICWLSMSGTHHASLVYAISFLLHMINHSINAVLYVVSGSKYREVFGRLVRCRNNRIVSVTDSNNSPNTPLTNNIPRASDIPTCSGEPKINEVQRHTIAPKMNLKVPAPGTSYMPESVL